MPHIVAEYSENLADKADIILRTAYEVVCESGLFNYESIKARHINYTHYILPEGAKHFVHITISILHGRSEEERASLSAAIFKKIRSTHIEIDKLSIDIHEMNASTYSK